MEKLELKHLAPYLPYGLKVIYTGELDDNGNRLDGDYIQIGEIAKIGSVEFRYINPIYWLDFKRGYFGINSHNFKTILRPLSDLTKEIEHDGEKFVPKEKLRVLSGAFNPDEDFKNTFTIHISDNIVIGFKATCMYVDQFKLFQKLLEWHFDIFGLIEKGLAVDINTLSE